MGVDFGTIGGGNRAPTTVKLPGRHSPSWAANGNAHARHRPVIGGIIGPARLNLVAASKPPSHAPAADCAARRYLKASPCSASSEKNQRPDASCAAIS